ncbi:MAG: glycosyltransferase family A protein, partial [Ferruginibacter sp.]
MIKPEISVIIPVRNGSQTLERCLTSIRSQTIQNIEIIILDSMSTDNSRQIADLFNVIIIDIPPGTFNHGLTRNIGTTVASANFLFFTVQDAWLSENNILERMLEHFSDKQVMGVVGHQAIPWGDSDKNPAYWFKRYSEPKIHERFFSDNSFQKLSKKERFKLS